MMGRVQKEKQRARPAELVVMDEANLPPVVSPRKHPWLLAIVAILFTGWLAFLLWMAING
jgi:hypothetical protein